MTQSDNVEPNPDINPKIDKSAPSGIKGGKAGGVDKSAPSSVKNEKVGVDKEDAICDSGSDVSDTVYEEVTASFNPPSGGKDGKPSVSPEQLEMTDMYMENENIYESVVYKL